MSNPRESADPFGCVMLATNTERRGTKTQDTNANEQVLFHAASKEATLNPKP